MEATINGKSVAFDVPSVKLSDYLRSIGLHPQSVAVEYNGTVIRKDSCESIFIHEGDRLEIVRFVGGGAF